MVSHYQLCMAAARDAGNRHMRFHGREVWDVSDFEYAAAEFLRLMGGCIDVTV